MQILHKLQTELKSLFFHPQKLDLFVSYFNAIVNKKKKKVPCGGHRLAPSGHSRSYKLDGECLVKEKRTGSVQGCWQTGHMVNQPGCLLVVVTLKRSSRWWLLLLIDTPWIMYQKGSINLQRTYITTSQKNLTDATFLHSIRLLEGCFGSSAFGLISDIFQGYGLYRADIVIGLHKISCYVVSWLNRLFVGFLIVVLTSWKVFFISILM